MSRLRDTHWGWFLAQGISQPLFERVGDSERPAALLSHTLCQAGLLTKRKAGLFFLLSKSAILPPCPALWFSLSEFTISKIIVFEVSREIVYLEECQDAQAL